MQLDLSNYINVPQLRFQIFCIQHYFNNINDNTSKKLNDDKYKDEYTHA